VAEISSFPRAHRVLLSRSRLAQLFCPTPGGFLKYQILCLYLRFGCAFCFSPCSHRFYGFRTIFPNCSLFSRRSCATRASRNGKLLSTTAFSLPEKICFMTS